MLGATLKYFNLFILPNPKFSIPVSEIDPMYHIRRPAAIDYDESFICQNPVNQSGPISFSTPKKAVVNKPYPEAGEYSTRRNTYPTIDHTRGPPSEFNEIVTVLSDPFEFGPSHNMDTSESSRKSCSRVRIITPSESPPRSSVNRKLTYDIAALYSSNGTEDRTTRNRNTPQTRTGDHTSSTSKGKEKRVSAPAILSSYCGNPGRASLTDDRGSPSAAIYALPHSHLISPLCLPPTLTLKVQRQNPPTSSNSSNLNRSIGTDLSPIIEDVHAFVDQVEVNEIDSSGSSYGQLLEEMTIDYFNTFRYGASGGMEWGNNERSRQTDYSAQHSTQGYGDIQDPGWGVDRLDPVEQSVLIPELTLTVPTPDLGSSEQFPSDAEPSPLLIDDIIDCPLKKKKISTVVASKAEGSADLETAFADMNSSGDLDTGLRLNRGSSGICREDRSDNPIPTGSMKGFTEELNGTQEKMDVKTQRSSSFRWSISRTNRRLNEQATNKKAAPIWKRLSQVLGSMTASSGRVRRSDSRAQINSMFTELAGTFALPISQSESEQQLLRYNTPGKRDCGPLAPVTPVCIHEEGEHAASRLFGLPSTREASKFLKTEAQRPPRIPDKSEKRRQAKQHSFGFNMKGFAKGRRYADDGMIKEL